MWYGVLVVWYDGRVWYTTWKKHGMWYSMLVIWYIGKTRYVVWWCGVVDLLQHMAIFAWWYGMFQHMRPARVDYVVPMSSVTAWYSDYWKVFRKPCGHTDRVAITAAETPFYTTWELDGQTLLYGIFYRRGVCGGWHIYVCVCFCCGRRTRIGHWMDANTRLPPWCPPNGTTLHLAFLWSPRAPRTDIYLWVCLPSDVVQET